MRSFTQVSILVLTLVASLSVLAVGREVDAPRTRIAFDQYKVHEVVTEDGIRLQLIELLGADGRPMLGAPPEILVHGFSKNMNTWHQVAPLERARGKRVFIANWRGHGQGATRSVGVDGMNPDLDPRMIFDNLPAFDVPALLDYVYRESGRMKVTWIGHSMGGMMMHLALAGVVRSRSGEMSISRARQRWIETRLASFTAAGSPVSFEKSGLAESLFVRLAQTAGIKTDRSGSVLGSLPFSGIAKSLVRDQILFWRTDDESCGRLDQFPERQSERVRNRNGIHGKLGAKASHEVGDV